MTSQPIPTPPDSEDARDLLPAYAIGATDAAEIARVADYLRQHPDAAISLADYTATAALLMGGVPRRDPPTALRQKVLDAAHAQRPVMTPPIMPVFTPHILPRNVAPNRSARLAQRPILAWVSSAAAVILLFMNLFWMSEVNDLRARQAVLEQANQAQMVVLQQISQKQMTDAVTMMVTGTKSELMDEAGAMRAMVMWEPGQTEALMFTHSLPILDQSRTYQLWLIDESGTPISAGTFSVDSDGRATLMFDAQMTLDALNGFGISVEPMGGSSAPTTTPLAMSAL